jgi:hypothetical protein
MAKCAFAVQSLLEVKCGIGVNDFRCASEWSYPSAFFSSIAHFENKQNNERKRYEI